LAIVKDIDSESLGVDEDMLNLLITKPFSLASKARPLAQGQQPADLNNGFFAALKERLLG